MPTMRMAICGTAFSTFSSGTPGAASFLNCLLIHFLMELYVTRLSMAMKRAPATYARLRHGLGAGQSVTCKCG